MQQQKILFILTQFFTKMFQCHLITLFFVKKYSIVFFIQDTTISSPSIPYPYLPCAAFNKPTHFAVKLSVIKKLLPFNYFLFLYTALRTSQRVILIIMGLDLPSLQTFGLPTWCARSKSFSCISISISSFIVFIIALFVFSPSDSRTPCNKKQLLREYCCNSSTLSPNFDSNESTFFSSSEFFYLYLTHQILLTVIRAHLLENLTAFRL